MILDAFSLRELSWVHEVRRAELPSPSFLPGVHVDGDNPGGSYENGCIDNPETDTAAAEHSDSGTLDPLLFHNSTPGGSYATSEKANFLQRSGRVYSDDGDICDNRVLRERRDPSLQVQWSTTLVGFPRRGKIVHSDR